MLPRESEDLRKRTSQQSDQDLLKIVNVDFKDYRKETIDFAKAELERRGILPSPGLDRLGDVATDTNREPETEPVTGATDGPIDVVRLSEKIRDAERELEEHRIEKESLIKELAELEEGRFGHYLIESVYVVILIVTVGAWTVIGFIVWMPLLIRTTTLLAGSVFYHSLFRDQARVTHAQRSVHFAIRFYVKGFEHFLVFYRQRREPDPPVGLFEPLTTMRWKELLIECAWVVVVWTVTYFVVHSLVGVLFRS